MVYKNLILFSIKIFGLFLALLFANASLDIDCYSVKGEKEKLSESSMQLFDEHFRPRAKLLQLLEIVGMGPLNEAEKPILQINRWAQANLLRKGERWEEQTTGFEALKSKIKPLLKEFGIVEAAYPSLNTYEGAILHGAFLSRVKPRLEFLIEQWKKGARFQHIYFLTGARPLEPQEKEALNDTELQTECDMIRRAWEQADVPKEFRDEVEVHFINAPMKKDPKSDKLLRPTTDDTIEYWLKEAPPVGNYLVVTNAPYMMRQGLVMKTLSPSDYHFDTVGFAAEEHEKMAIFLDEVARYIFQMKQFSEKIILR